MSEHETEETLIRIRSVRELLQRGYADRLLELYASGCTYEDIKQELRDVYGLDVTLYTVRAACLKLGTKETWREALTAHQITALRSHALKRLAQFDAICEVAAQAGDTKTLNYCTKAETAWWDRVGRFVLEAPPAVQVDVQVNQTHNIIQSFLELPAVKENPKLAEQFLAQLKAKAVN